MIKKKFFAGISFLLTLSMVFVCFNQINGAHKAAAYIVKEPSAVTESEKLDPIIYNGEEMYVAKASFYDYHSDCEVGTSSTPEAITNSLDGSKNTFELFNNKLFNLMKYGSSTESPANYPMYQGRFVASGAYTNIYRPGDEAFNTSTNYWVAANTPQGQAVATQGLVDPKLTTGSDGISYLTQSNTKTGKKANVPFFDKKFLTSNKFDGSELSLATVRENVSFPFRRVTEHGITYYQFYSNEDTIRINTSGKVDYLGHKNSAEQVKDPHGNTGFFPYNTPSESRSNSLNYGHGVKIEIPFLMTPDGKLNGKDIVFEFSGDDDVWVFIDGNLALDIGGSHGEIKGSINFSDLTSTVDKVKDNTYAFATHSTTSLSPSKIFNKHKTLFNTELKQALNDTTKIHTLTFFYMERGMDVSNLKLNFNLPEPTKLTVSNTVTTDKVNKTFADETAAVAKKDAFIYDIADKTLNKAASMEINNKESIMFANEFHANDTIIVQESKLKDTSRILAELYTTNWILKDATNEIAKANNSLVVDDDRASEDKTLKFSNKDNSNSPVLTAAFTNAPKVGTFTINTDITEEYKSNNENANTDTFNYTVSYKNVFGGGSTEVLYKGDYQVINSEGTATTKTTTDGVVSATADETIKILNIPVKTELNVQTSLTGNKKLAKVATTSNFTLNNDKTSATGTINKLCNEIEYTVTDTTEAVAPEKEVIATPEDTETDPEKDLHTLDKGATDMTKESNDKSDKAGLDDSPSTADSTDLRMWIILLAISVALCMGSLVSITKRG